MAANDPATTGTLWRIYAEFMTAFTRACIWALVLGVLGLVITLFTLNAAWAIAGGVAGAIAFTVVIAQSARDARRQQQMQAVPRDRFFP